MRLSSNAFIGRTITTAVSQMNGQNRHQHDEFTQKAREESMKKGEQRQKADEDDSFKVKILDAAMTFVPVHGWSKESLKNGAESVGYPAVSAGIFSNAPIDLIHHHYARSNILIAQQMKEAVDELKHAIQPIKTGPFLRKHVESRLRMNVPYLKHWPEALSIMVLPQNGQKSLTFGLELMDSFWFSAGDRSTDYNW